MLTRVLAALALAGALASGCADLLPKSRMEVASPWGSFERARASIDRIVPYTTTRTDLAAMGIDPYASPNVRLLTYSDIVLRFPLGGTIGPEKLDPGLRKCLEAGKTCSGFAITAQDIRRDRIGDFWLDALNFRREVSVSGWTFNALILLVDEHVVYTNYGGQPLVKESETTRQPLGPIQGWGEAIPGFLK